jgi:hypothetical protein
MGAYERVRFAVFGPLFAALISVATSANSHHSSSAFYDVEDRVTVTGKVTEFLFANPHAILKFEVTGADGAMQEWTAETTSPSLLRRRGWSQQSFEPGAVVTLEGMPSLDGSWLIRITRAWAENGSEIGIPTGVND